MKPFFLAAASVCAVTALAFAGQAGAQAAKPKAAAPTPAAARAAAAAPAGTSVPLTLTATVPGVCVFSQERLMQGSTVGAFVIDRLKQLDAVVNSEISSDVTSLQNDAKTLDGQRATLQADVFAQRQQALQQREGALQQKTQLRQREMQATEQKALGRVLQATGPLIGPIVQQHGCGIVLDGNSVLAANAALDITPQVITALNGALTQFAFDREHLDQPGAATN